MLRHKQATLEDFMLDQETTSEEPAFKPIIRYVKPVPRASPIIHGELGIPTVDVVDGSKTVKNFKITVRGKP